jgi:Ni,Fe-hydrogenase I large subunit
MSRRITTGPLNRVEGELEVTLEIAQERVTEAWVTAPLYRGFESLLQGKNPLDALVYVPRICGICSVAQSLAAAGALAALQGVAMPRNGTVASNLILACENLADHLTHFYLFFMPDFADQSYRQEPWFAAASARFRALEGSAAAEVLPARADFLHMMGILAGKWPHSLALQPGGTTRSIEVQERARLSAILFGFRRFLQQTLFGDSLEAVVAIDSGAALERWRGESEAGDLRHFLQIADALQLQQLGCSDTGLMSYGAYNDGDRLLFAAGSYSTEVTPLQQQLIREEVSYSWMQPQPEPLHPFDGVTRPDVAQQQAYSWCKAPRLDGAVVEVGALARQRIDGHPLIVDLLAQSGANVRNRVVARLLELARVVLAMEQWVAALEPGAPFCNQLEMPEQAQGYGLVEAARGGLGHWIKVDRGRILNYQIIAPTSWNFSPRDRRGVAGALEQALVGAPVREGERDPISVQHIVRSFDPCMVCTVH